MAKLNTKLSFTNAKLSKDESGNFLIEEFKKKDGINISVGKWNLTEQLNGVIGVEGLKLNYDTTSELDSQF